ncbi:MAG: antibiotic biosynthesis monooxygenase [Gammaproteobacteria bacterium]|nr:MAG: antibiotic biosynthesis monooxygenase [Gammaproteobacteria bacterium]
MSFATTPKPPYFAVIFTSIRTKKDNDGYQKTADRMVELARKMPGFLGIESVREKIGITVSYWQDLESIENWRQNSEHKIAQEQGIKKWYQNYHIRITEVIRDYASNS